MRDRAPLEWARTQSNLGNTLLVLGQRESGTTLVEEAIAADCAALEEWTRDRTPHEWANSQEELGNALATLKELLHKERSSHARTRANLHAGNAWYPGVSAGWR